MTKLLTKEPPKGPFKILHEGYLLGTIEKKPDGWYWTACLSGQCGYEATEKSAVIHILRAETLFKIQREANNLIEVEDLLEILNNLFREVSNGTDFSSEATNDS